MNKISIVLVFAGLISAEICYFMDLSPWIVVGLGLGSFAVCTQLTCKEKSRI